MKQLVKIFNEEEYLGVAFIEGVKYIKGDYIWFTVLELLTLDGKRMDGLGLCIYPFVPLLEYKDEKESD